MLSFLNSRNVLLNIPTRESLRERIKMQRPYKEWRRLQ